MIRKPLLFDGATGSYLTKKYGKTTCNLWSSIYNLTHPEYVFELQKEYVESGADIISTNTFRTNPLFFEKSNFGLTNSEFVRISCEITNNLKKLYTKIQIAGSNPPAEDSYQRDRRISYDLLESNHHKHIDLLYSNGVDLILNETLSHRDEIEITAKFCSRNSIPFITSIFFLEDMKILSGENLTEIISLLKEYAPIAISFNCISPEIFNKFFLSKDFDFNYAWGVYLNCGKSSVHAPVFDEIVTPIEFSEINSSFLFKEPLFIGGCCGSTPTHIRKLNEKINEIFRN